MANPILISGAASDQSLYEEISQTATNQSRAEGFHPVGTRAQLDDGRVFYYMSAGTTALNLAALCVVPATIGLNRSANHNDITLTATGAVPIGTTDIALSETDVDTDDIITNEYKDGYMYVEDSTGQGQYAKVRSHTQFDASGSATGNVEISDGLVTALAATSQVSLARNPYDRIIVSTTAEEETPVGVPLIGYTASTALATDVTTAVAATTTYFGWVQTWGPCAVIVDGTTMASGMNVMSSNAADGSLEVQILVEATPNTGADRPTVGWGLVSAAAADADYVLVDLRIRP